MDAIDTLIAEHRLIERYLGTLELALAKIEKNEAVPQSFFEQAVRFSREFVDKYHHFKEELLMFTALAQKHAGEFDAAIEALRNQHENGRNHVAEIDYAKDGYQAEMASASTVLLEHLGGYVSMLREHIRSEDHHLYPMARRAFLPEEMTELMAEFHRADEKAGPDFFEKSRERVEKMESLLSAVAT